MKCKQALIESDGDIEAAFKWLQTDGVTVTTYYRVHPRDLIQGCIGVCSDSSGRIGVLVEVKCQTHSNRLSEIKTLADNLAMQIAACPSVEYIGIEDIPPTVVARERELLMGCQDLADKPNDVKNKLINSRLDKHLRDLSLLSQPCIYDLCIDTGEYLVQQAALLEENIYIRRFVRWML